MSSFLSKPIRLDDLAAALAQITPYPSTRTAAAAAASHPRSPLG
jgi:hypothetical protein